MKKLEDNISQEFMAIQPWMQDEARQEPSIIDVLISTGADNKNITNNEMCIF